MRAIQFMYENFAQRYAKPPLPFEADTAIRFADYLLDHPEELEAALKQEEEFKRAWKEDQAKRPPKSESGV